MYLAFWLVGVRYIWYQSGMQDNFLNHLSTSGCWKEKKHSHFALPYTPARILTAVVLMRELFSSLTPSVPVCCHGRLQFSALLLPWPFFFVLSSHVNSFIVSTSGSKERQIELTCLLSVSCLTPRLLKRCWEVDPYFVNFTLLLFLKAISSKKCTGDVCRVRITTLHWTHLEDYLYTHKD